MLSAPPESGEEEAAVRPADPQPRPRPALLHPIHQQEVPLALPGRGGRRQGEVRAGEQQRAVAFCTEHGLNQCCSRSISKNRKRSNNPFNSEIHWKS